MACANRAYTIDSQRNYYVMSELLPPNRVRAGASVVRNSPLRAVERLEERDVPAVFGVPWLDGSNLTLSFAPDGTSVLGDSSVLSQSLAPLGDSTAKLEILRAFQTWVEQANVNIGLIPDGGQAFGANGAI